MIAFSYFSSSAPWTATVDPSKVIIHSGYDQKSSVNDIALVIVPTIAINGSKFWNDRIWIIFDYLKCFTDTIAAAILPSQSDDLLDLSTKVTTASGYGSIRFGANKLMFINSHVITNAAVSCTRNLIKYFTLILNQGGSLGPEYSRIFHLVQKIFGEYSGLAWFNPSK